MNEEVDKHVSYSFEWSVPSTDAMSGSSTRRVARGNMDRGSDRFYLWLASCEQNHSFTAEEWRELNRRVETLIAVKETEDGK